ncbi:hypothetical protein N7478_005280 [Penicillium angulare]|uniref:uncharacterized protein n=1 Tax=Penicillium angulare TaxID=116970 RepID=UPI0025406B01|nr:uncharacterized protein N7478_005280 [Penicillium angulare]KAJ5279908.1 hypothetical protein N7478_005280 [Penicillium angulare]
MPRISTSLLIKAYRENSLLPLLLRECRSLTSARNELRWLRERALHDSQSASRLTKGSLFGWRTRLRSMCQRRSKGVPLQYILGDQPFGDLEIICRRGVLIPRSDTESFTVQAAKTVRQMALEHMHDNQAPQMEKPLRVLDLCTGTGCIALLLHTLLAPQFKDLMILGVDISDNALNLARTNLEYNLRQGLLSNDALTQVHFQRADVLNRGLGAGLTVKEALEQHFNGLGGKSEPHSALGLDLLISNPPYISTVDFRNGTTSRSVRRFEPELALVPPATSKSAILEGCNPEDIFYHHILTLSLQSVAKTTVLECGDIMQARRVVAMHKKMISHKSGYFDTQIWPSSERDLAENGFHHSDGARCVIITRRDNV